MNVHGVIRTRALVAADHILEDIKGRQGIGDELDSIDEAPREEMVGEWREIIADALWAFYREDLGIKEKT